jgi:hypothetical protein
MPSLDDHGHLVGEGRVVAAQFGIVPARQWLWPSSCCRPSPFSVVRPAVPPEQEAARAHVAGLPGQVAHALQAEHRVVDVERDHRHVVRAVRGGRGDPAGHRAAFVDAFLQHLAVLVLAVVHQLVGVLRLVQLAHLAEDAELAEHAFHAEGARLRRHDRHDALADLPCRAPGVPSICTKAIVVEISRSPCPLSRRSKLRQRRHFERFGRLAPALRQVAAECAAALVQVLHLRAVFGGLKKGMLGQLSSDRDVEAVAESAQRVLVIFLVWWAIIWPSPDFAHAVALDGLGQDHGGLPVCLTAAA